VRGEAQLLLVAPEHCRPRAHLRGADTSRAQVAAAAAKTRVGVRTLPSRDRCRAGRRRVRPGRPRAEPAHSTPPRVPGPPSALRAPLRASRRAPSARLLGAPARRAP
jgi:hypothetical protein